MDLRKIVPLVCALLLPCAPAHAFDPARCTNIVLAEGLTGVTAPTGPVRLAADPGLFGGAVECQLSQRADGGIELMAFEFIANEGDRVSVNYLAAGVVMMLQTPDGQGIGRIAMCRPGDPGAQCYADLFINGALVVEMGMAIDPARNLLGLVADVGGILAGTEMAGDFATAPPSARSVTLSLSSRDAPFVLTPLSGQPGFFALSDMSELRAFYAMLVQGLPSGRPGLKLDIVLQDASGSRIHSSEQSAETLSFILNSAVTMGEAILAETMTGAEEKR
jgi:hypothetical protein